MNRFAEIEAAVASALSLRRTRWFEADGRQATRRTWQGRHVFPRVAMTDHRTMKGCRRRADPPALVASTEMNR